MEDGIEDRITISAVRYDRSRGVIIDDQEHGHLVVELSGNAILISGDAPGLRDLARWCLALSDELVAPGVHVHLDPGLLLPDASEPLILQRTTAPGAQTNRA